MPSAPMPCSDITKLAHFVDRNRAIKRSGKSRLFHFPNFPMDLGRKDAFSIEKEILLDSRLKKVIGLLESECDRKRTQKEEVKERERTQKEEAKERERT